MINHMSLAKRIAGWRTYLCDLALCAAETGFELLELVGQVLLPAGQFLEAIENLELFLVDGLRLIGGLSLLLVAVLVVRQFELRKLLL